MRLVKCTQCETNIRCPDDRAGLEAKCPKCGKPFTVPMQDDPLATSPRPPERQLEQPQAVADETLAILARNQTEQLRQLADAVNEILTTVRQQQLTGYSVHLHTTIIMLVAIGAAVLVALQFVLLLFGPSY